MAYRSSYQVQGQDLRFEVKQHVNNSRYSGMFRGLSRDVSGASCDIPSGNKILFGYVNQPFPNTLVSVMSLSLADGKSVQPSGEFCCEFYHQITYLFVKKDFQCRGYGKRMLQRALTLMRQHNSKRPVRVQSAGKAIEFFEKQYFRKQGDLYRTAGCCESPALFNQIQNMEKDL